MEVLVQKSRGPDLGRNLRWQGQEYWGGRMERAGDSWSQEMEAEARGRFQTEIGRGLRGEAEER